MEKRKNPVVILLAVLGGLVLVSICTAVLLGAGALAFFGIVRSDTSDRGPSLPPIVTTVAVPDPEKSPELFPFSSIPGLPIQDVQVEIGVGSPIPVEVVAAGEWPSPCARLVDTYISYVADRQIHIELLSDPGQDCASSGQGLPFSIRIPLNMTQLPAGKYSVNVNGVQSDFDWEFNPDAPQGFFPEFTAAQPGDLDPLTLQDAHIEIGSGAPAAGEPMPVDVVISGDWPQLCSQLAMINTSASGQNIYIEVLATPRQADCPQDLVGLPFALRIPLNMVAMPEGEYTVTINDWQARFTWPPTGEPLPEPFNLNAPMPMRMAYVGHDGNLMLNDLPDFGVRQLTTDAALPTDAEAPILLEYTEPALSSDGRYLAYRRAFGAKQNDGMALDLGLWVMDLETLDAQEIYALSPGGFSWQPGTHLLAYAPELQGGYFSNRPGSLSPEFAEAIKGYDASTGETRDLVPPYGGYAMFNPVWSQDGRFLSFDEVLYMEGRGPLAYFDFASGEYISLEQPLGNYSWSPDGETLAYDSMVYIASGTEFIQTRYRQGGEASDFSADIEPGYASQPAFSPVGDQIAYLTSSHPESGTFTVNVQAYPSGEPRELGSFENIYQLRWALDGSRLIFSAGPYGEQFIVQIDLESGVSSQLTTGMQPTLSSIP